MNDFFYVLLWFLPAIVSPWITLDPFSQMLFYGIHKVVTLVTYILTAQGYSAIARRRGIQRDWLAWIPGGRDFLVGAISDQYQQVVLGKRRKKRKVLLTLSLLCFGSLILSLAFLLTAFVLAFLEFGGYSVSSAAYTMEFLFYVLNILALGFGLIGTVVHCTALYDVYRSVDPRHAVCDLVLSIVLLVPAPFFLFFNRNKDGGMIPLQPAPQQDQNGL